MKTKLPFSESTFIFKVTDDSLSLEFDKGVILYVDPEEKAKNKSIVAIKANNEDLCIKQLLLNGSKKYLKSLDANTTNQPAEMLSSSLIVGVVVGSYRDVLTEFVN